MRRIILAVIAIIVAAAIVSFLAIAVWFFITANNIIEQVPPLPELPTFVDSPEVRVIELPVPLPRIEEKEEETAAVPQVDNVGLPKIIEDASQVSEAPQTLLEQETILQDELYALALERLVNLICPTPNNEVVVVSGWLISEEGHILTNAHISDPLEEKKCQVRRGSPAKAFARAEEIFKSATYTATDDVETKARNDVAIWKIVASSGSAPLPETFPFFEPDPNAAVEIGKTLTAFSYPSELLGYETILRNLTILSTQTTVTQTDGTLILSSHSLSSQSGSSGGVLLSRETAKPMGLIFAISKEENISERLLYSLSMAAVDNIVKKQTGRTLGEFVASGVD